MADTNDTVETTTTAPTLATTTSELGQSVAEATGNAYKDLPSTGTDVPDYAAYDAAGVGSTLSQNAQVESGLNFVDADKSTVQGQLKSLLSEDSSYIQSAKAAGTRQAAARGMLNSSMAAGASQAKAIEAALPIAQQDAQTYAAAQNAEQTAKYNQNQIQSEAIVSSGLSIQNKTNETLFQNTQNAFQAAMQGATESNKVLLQDMQNLHDDFTAQVEAQHQLLLQREQLTAEKAQYLTEQSSTIMQNYQINVENMLTDPDFLDLGAKAVQNAINQMQQLARNSINFLGASAQVDLSPYVNSYLTNLSINTGTTAGYITNKEE